MQKWIEEGAEGVQVLKKVVEVEKALATAKSPLASAGLDLLLAQQAQVPYRPPISTGRATPCSNHTIPAIFFVYFPDPVLFSVIRACVCWTLWSTVVWCKLYD